MQFKRLTTVAAVAAIAAGVAACGSSNSSSSNANASAGSSSSSAGKSLPTVTMMVGGIDKQIYLPYQLAQDLGYFKKYGVNMQLSTEQTGGVGAETAMVSGQVDMAGAWYIHAAEFTAQGKPVEDIVQLSGAPGEREMCDKGSNITSPAQWKGKSVGVTDLGSGTDNLTRYMAARAGLHTSDFHRVGVGDGATLLAAMQNHEVVCAMTTQPTVNAVETKGIGYSAFNLASAQDAKKLLGGEYPAAAVLVRVDWANSHKQVVQDVVDAMVATMHYIATHSAADIAAHMPADFVSNGLTTKANYISTLAADKGQFLPDGLMPAGAAQTAVAIDKFAGALTGNVNIPSTYTNSYVEAAHKQLGF
jgi:NitT/TauT family transport system substrate-binding protein